MSNFSADLIPNFVRGKNEVDLQRKLSAMQLNSSKLLKVINIHPSPGGGLTAWYFHDVMTLGSPLRVQEEETPKKKIVKKAKKKVTKKA